MICTTSLLFKTSWTHGSLEKIKVRISFSSWASLTLLNFHQYANVSWMKIAFLNAVIIIFCLIYLLNICHSNQNPPVSPLEKSVSIVSLATYMWPYFNARWCSHMKTIRTFFFSVTMVWPLSWRLDLVTNTKCKVYLSLSCPQPKFNWVSKVWEIVWESQ